MKFELKWLCARNNDIYLPANQHRRVLYTVGRNSSGLPTFGKSGNCAAIGLVHGFITRSSTLYAAALFIALSVKLLAEMIARCVTSGMSRNLAQSCSTVATSRGFPSRLTS